MSPNSTENPETGQRLLSRLFALVSLEGMLVIASLFLIPSDPERAFLWGKSVARWAMILVSGCFMLPFLFVLLSPESSRRRQLQQIWSALRRYSDWEAGLPGLNSVGMLALIVLIGWLEAMLYQPDGIHMAVLVRLLPMVLWAAALVAKLSYAGFAVRREADTSLDLNGYLAQYGPTFFRERRELRAAGKADLLFVLIGLAFLFFLANLGYILFFGPINSDEGWYLVAGRLVYQGKIPYQDFAFTQTPLLPYVYGLPQQILRPGMYLGRFTSAVIFISMVLLSMEIVRRFAGRAGAFWTPLVFAFFTAGIYYGVIVKTYILATFFMVATLFTLTSNLRDSVKYPAAAGMALAASFVRLSAFGFSVMLFGYCFMKSKNAASRAAHLGVLAAGAILLSVFLFPHPENLYWNLLGYHLEVSRSAIEAGGSYGQRMVDRLPALLGYAGPLLAMPAGALMVMGFEKRWPRLTENAGHLAVYSVSVASFFILNQVSRNDFVEYHVPGLLAAIPVLVASLNFLVVPQRRTNIGAYLAVLVMSGSLAGLGFQGELGLWAYERYRGGLPLESVERVADFIRAETRPSDQLLALSFSFVAIDARRELLPGLTLAQFSPSDYSTETALRLKVVNDEILLDFLESGAARALVLTTSETEKMEALLRASEGAGLAEHYELAYREERFGQNDEPVFVFIQRED